MTTTFEARSEQHASATVEIGAMIHNGQRFEALGSVVDFERGILVGYPAQIHTDRPPFYALQTWDGQRIHGMVLVRKAWRYCFGRKVEIYYWRALIDGRRYSGRNSGLGMVLTLRAGKQVA